MSARDSRAGWLLHAIRLTWPALFVCACHADTASERFETTSSAIVNPTPNTTGVDENFIVYLHQSSGSDPKDCAGALIAPNLVLTAKACTHVYQYQASVAKCDGSGEPQAGAPGGGTNGPAVPDNIQIFPGQGGRDDYSNGRPPAAVGAMIVDDGSPNLCSHDIVYVVLDKPLADLPIAKLRLSPRPTTGTQLSLAAWGGHGVVGEPASSAFREKRAGIVVRAVGAEVFDPFGTATIAPRTFETGPGGCLFDGGAPAFDETTKAVFGVLTRATDIRNCASEAVSNFYVIPGDWPDLLRTAFTKANAEPWLEGRAAAGYRPLDEACGGSVECGVGTVCAGSPKSCRVDCRTNPACPTNLVCGSEGGCVPPEQAGTTTPPTPPPGADPNASNNGDANPEEGVTASSCATSRASSPNGGALLAALATCIGAARRIRLARRRS